MNPASTPIDFFDEPKLASLYKLDLFQKYLVPWSRKLGSGWNHLWVVDGFAGAGAYRPDDQGEGQDGSPRLAARWAALERERRGHPLVRCVNVERDEACFAELERQTAEWAELVTNIQGTFQAALPRILRIIDRDPAFFFLDPFGVNGIEMSIIEEILAARGRKTEMLIHFSERSFKRMAGHARENDQRTQVGQKVADAKLARLTAMMGTPLWRPRWETTSSFDEAMEAMVALYLSQLRERGFKFANQIRMRDRFGQRSRYRLVFCTNSIHGVEMMSDRVRRYEQELRASDKPGQEDLLAPLDERNALSVLADRMHEVGLQLDGRASLEQVRHSLVGEFFGLYTQPDFARALRQLVNEGRIRRKTAKGIGEREPLRFIEPVQGSLLEDVG